MPQTPKPIHFLKAYDNSYSKMNREHKYKDKDECKDNDKDLKGDLGGEGMASIV